MIMECGFTTSEKETDYDKRKEKRQNLRPKYNTGIRVYHSPLFFQIFPASILSGDPTYWKSHKNVVIRRRNWNDQTIV